MFKAGYWTHMQVNGREPELVELLSVQPLDSKYDEFKGEFGQAWGLTWRTEAGLEFSEKRYKLPECDCDFCCTEVIGAEPRRSVAQM